jgi:hypothetical protein
MKINYDQKIFRPVSNSENGEVSEEMVFHYQQVGNVLSCTYQGKNILLGHLIGLVDDDGNIDMRYHQLNTKGELMTGVCISRPEIGTNGKIRLHEEWEWTSGDGSRGSSVLEEI